MKDTTPKNNTQRMTLFLDPWVFQTIEQASQKQGVTKKDIIESKIKTFFDQH